MSSPIVRDDSKSSSAHSSLLPGTPGRRAGDEGPADATWPALVTFSCERPTGRHDASYKPYVAPASGPNPDPQIKCLFCASKQMLSCDCITNEHCRSHNIFQKTKLIRIMRDVHKGKRGTCTQVYYSQRLVEYARSQKTQVSCSLILTFFSSPSASPRLRVRLKNVAFL
jgi:hypothetical protein